MNAIVTRNGWLNGQTSLKEYPSGMALGEFADRNMPAQLRQYVAVQRNGVPLKDWESHVPGEDEHILLYIMPQGGGDDGKSGVLSVVAIGLAIAAPHLSPLIFGGGFAGSAAYWVGASLVMNSLSRALIKPPQQQKPISFDRSSNPFLYFTGIGNRVEPWGNVPRIYGRMRYYPKLIVAPEQRTEGNAIYYYLAFDFGYGPLQLSNFKLGEVQLENYSGVEQFIHHSFTKTSTLQYFESGSNSVSVNQELQDTGEKIIIGTSLNSHRATVSLALPNGLYGIYAINGNNFRIGVTVYFEARLVNDPPDAWQPLYKFGPVRSSNLLIGFVSRPINIKLQKWFANGVWNVGIPQGATSIRADYVNYFDYTDDLHFPILSYQWIIDPTGKIPLTKKARVIARSNATYTVVFSWDGEEVIYSTYATEAEVPTSLASTMTFQNVDYLAGLYLTKDGVDPYTSFVATDILIDFEIPGQYEIRVGKQLPSYNPNNNYIINNVYLTNYISYADFIKKVFLPEAPHTVVELKIRATNQLSGMIDNFNAIAESLLPVWNGSDWDVPVHDPVTNQWSVPPTRNPAWIYLDVIRGSANKRPVSDELIDIDAFVAWAGACSTPAPNDPDNASFNCDLVISSESTVRETLQVIAATGRAAPARRDSKYSVIRLDETQTPVQLITPKNTRDFTATINYINPPHALKIAFIDESDGYSSSETIVYNDGFNSSNATLFEELNLPGSTRHNQVWRLGRYYMAAAQLQRERVKVVMDYEHLVCQRGDMVLVAHDVLKAGGLPRRVIAIAPDVAGDVLTLDEAVTLVTAIRYRGSDDIISVNQVGDNEIRLPAGLQPPFVGDLIEYGVSEEIRAPFIVEEIVPGENLSATIQMVEHRPEIETAITQPIPPRIPRPGASGAYSIGPVQNLAANTSTYFVEALLYSDVGLSWLPPSQGIPSYYVVYEIIDDINYFIAITESNSYDAAKTINVSAIEESTNYTFGVQAVIDRVGLGEIETITVTILPDTTVPPDVEGFGCNAQTGTLFLFWSRVISQDAHHLEIRYSSDSVSGDWGTASLISDQIPITSTDIVVPLRPGVYFIKAVDGAGNYSTNAAATVVQIDDLEYVKQFASIDFSPFDDGTYDRVNNSITGTLRLDEDEPIGYYYPDPVDYGISLLATTKMRLYASVTGNVVSIANTLDSDWFIPLSNATPLAPSAVIGSNAIDGQIDFRWRFASADPWSAWTRLYVADVTAQDIEFRVSLRSRDPKYVPQVTAAGIRADYHERRETGQDIAVPENGTHIDFEFPFAETPVVAITLQFAHQGDYYLISNLDRAGFDIEIFHGNHNSEAGQIDFIATGYGKEY